MELKVNETMDLVLMMLEVTEEVFEGRFGGAPQHEPDEAVGEAEAAGPARAGDVEVLGGPLKRLELDAVVVGGAAALVPGTDALPLVVVDEPGLQPRELPVRVVPHQLELEAGRGRGEEEAGVHD